MGSAAKRAQHSALQLRTAAVVLPASLALLVIIAAVLGFELRREARRGLEARKSATEQIQAANSLRGALLQYTLDSDLAYLTKSPDDERKRLDSEASVISGLAQERSRPMDVDQRRAFADAEAKVKTYLLARQRVETKGSSIREVFLVTSSPLNEALGATARLANLASRRLARENAAARSRVNEQNMIAAIVGPVLLISFIGAWVGLRRLVIQPLLGLDDAIRGFAGGDRSARATEGGTAEFQATAHMFNQMVDHMVHQEQQRLAFLAGVAHNLRNPLAALRMSTHLLRPGLSFPSQEKVLSTTALVDRQVTRLDRMVADFLDASRIESGHLELRLARRDLLPLAEEAVLLYAGSSYSHEVTLRRPDEEVPVVCDATRIEQVLNNLISNAIKYSPRGGPVRVTVSRENGFAAVEVADRGIGIAHDQLDQVFEPFRRTGASRETIPGVGLGLWVSRRIVQAHGGSLEVSSDLGVGSTFRVRLPLAPRAVAGEAAEQQPSGPG